MFLDHAATTPVDPRVADFYRDRLGAPLNASSIHRQGQAARARLEFARRSVADLLGLRAEEVIFTSSASESNNLVIRGLTSRRRRMRVPTIIASSPLEHSCVRECLNWMSQEQSITLRTLPVEESGRVRLDSGVDGTHLLCLMHAQNETGIVQDVAAAAFWRKRSNGLWLCDATQTLGRMHVNVRELKADFVTGSSHKLYAPAGVGLLAGTGLAQLDPQIIGGPQEGSLRAGTQPVALIEAFAFALKLAREDAEHETAAMKALEDEFLDMLRERGVSFRLNGNGPRLAGFLNMSVDGFSGADMVIALDTAGICVSSGSACATGVMEVSPALAAMFPDDAKRAAGAVRITPGRGVSVEDMRRAAEVVARLAGKA